MSVNTLQTYKNSLRSFYLSASDSVSSVSQVATNPMPYQTPLVFVQNTSNNTNFLSNGSISGFNNSLYIQDPNSITFQRPGPGNQPTTVVNLAATGSQVGLFVSTTAFAPTLVAGKQLVVQAGGEFPIALLQDDANGNPVQNWEFYTPTSGLFASTIQLLNYQAPNYLFNSNNSVVFRADPRVPNLQIPMYQVEAQGVSVSTINGLNLAPQFVASNTITPITSSNTLVQQFSISNQSNYIFEGKVSGEANWTGVPASNDYIVINFNGGSAGISDNLSQTIYPYLVSLTGQTSADINLAGVFQTSATATNIDLNVDVNANVPSNYAIDILNGYITPLKHQ